MCSTRLIHSPKVPFLDLCTGNCAIRISLDIGGFHLFKMNIFFTCVALFLASVAFAEETTTRDLMTRIYDIKCSGEGLQLDMSWDTAVTPLGPNKIALEGKEIPLGGLKMSFFNGDSAYETQDLKITLKEADKDKKSFETVASYKGKDIKLTCSNKKSTQFLRKRKVTDGSEDDTASVKTTRDLVTKISEVKCIGDGHDIEMKWDSAVTPMGPTEIVLDGRNLPLGGMTLSIDKNETAYDVKGFKIKLKDSDKSKKAFSPEAQYNGKNLSLKCTSSESTKFLRKRNVEAPASGSSTGAK